MRYLAALVLTFGLPLAASAQDAPLPQAPPASVAPPDLPVGAPYNVGRTTYSDTVPLRDFLSSRIDQIRTEMIDRIDQENTLQQKILDERDRQYAQRFEAQQQALAAAFQASKALVDGALSAAKEAVTKAEDAANKRFDSVNEFRQTLTDQTNNLLSKDVAEARFSSIEQRLINVTQRLDETKNLNEGASNLWGWIIGALGVGIAIIVYLTNLTRMRSEANAPKR